MGRKKSAEVTIQTAVRLSPGLVSAIDAERAAILTDTGVFVSRSAVIKAWLGAVARSGRGKK